MYSYKNLKQIGAEINQADKTARFERLSISICLIIAGIIAGYGRAFIVYS